MANQALTPSAMKAIQRKERINKYMSILLIYALFFQEFVPFARSMDTIEFNRSEASIPFFSTSDVSEVSLSEKENLIDRDEVLAIETTDEQQISLAVTGGPGQSESSGFSLGTTDGLVDKFTGDFSYSIPLMNVEGYPIVINYNSNVGMNTDASWVGLGWDLNVGSVSREMRGLPDEFNGDQKIVKTVNQLDNKTTDGKKYGGYLSWRPGGSFVSISKFQLNYPTIQLTALWGVYNNSYQGFGKTFEFGLQSSISVGEDTRFGPTFGLGFSRDTKNGVGRNTSIGLGFEGGWGLTYSKNFNSRAGITNRSIGLGASNSYSSAIGNLRASYGTSTSLTYGSVTSVPSIQYSGGGSSYRLGLDLFGEFHTAGVWSIGLKTDTYFSDSYIKYGHSTNQTIEQDAYGYLHSGKRVAEENKDDLAIMDFNRTNDFQYSSDMKNLPFSFQTYDIFRASALGMTGTFRAHRSDIGTYFNPNASSENKGNTDDVRLGVVVGEGGPGVKLKIGYSRGTQKGDAESGNWENASFTTNGDNVLSFNEEAAGNNFDQSAYFKPLGESTPRDSTQFNLLGGSDIAYLDVNKSPINDEIIQSNFLKIGGSGGVSLSGSTVNTTGNIQQVTTTCFGPKTAEQAAQESVYYLSQKEGEYLNLGNNVDGLNRIDTDRAANHLSQVDILSADGMHYTYGIPAYDIETNQVSFAVGNRPTFNDACLVDASTNLVRYGSGDNSINNDRGRGHYYDKTTVPAYAHSFLLTEMRSSDYVDIGSDGLSVNDIGSYYKFNHTQYYGETNKDPSNPTIGKNGRPLGNYKWRFPISDDLGNQAMHNEGFEGTDLDDMANYTYGEKEIWYTHSIESKNFVAEFYLEDRKDAYGVLDENGQIDLNAPLKNLSKIVLYNRSERMKNGVNAIPLQTVEFVYNYGLCRNTPANKHTYSPNIDYAQSGKLTLTEIRVYSGNSKEGGLSKYKFDYSSFNPEFNYAASDGWGNYKPNDPTQPNSIFPYAEQDPLIADANINAWKLKAINNPMGGRVEIDYEADEYVTVQDKRTMKHLDIEGMTNLIEFLPLYNESSWNIGTSPYVYDEFRKKFSYTGLLNFVTTNFTGSNFLDFYNSAFKVGNLALYTAKFGRLDLDHVPNNVMIFKLDEGLSPTTFTTKESAGDFVRESYFRNTNQPNDIMHEILFKTHVNVKTENGVDIKEYIPAFAQISEDFDIPFGGALGSVGNSFRAIGVMPPSANGNYEYGYVIVDPVNSSAREKKNNKGDDKNGVLLHPLQRTALDFVRQNLPDKVYGSCNGCDPNLSIDNKVFWGGDIYKIMIEAGYVSSFEHDYSTMRLYVSDSIKYGGNARVSKVTYKDKWNNLSGEYDSDYSWFYGYSLRTAETGVASYEPQAIIDESSFYRWDTYVNSAKKFPDETRFTPTPVAGALFPIPSIGYADVRVRFSGAEAYGYSKAEFYTAADFPTIEKVAVIDKSYVKKRKIILGNSVDLYGFAQGVVVETNDFHGKPKQFSVYDNLDNIQSRSTYVYNDLDEKVPMIDRKGMINMEAISMEYDIHADSRFAFNESKYYSIGGSMKFLLPLFIPTIPLPSFHRQKREQGFFSTAVIKHINRSAVVKRIETEYLNSINTAENLLYDKYTGSVLLSSLTDEYEDKLYSMSYPSHWYQRGLRDVCSAENRLFLFMSITGSTLDLSTVTEDVFAEGDQIDIQLTGANGGGIVQAIILSIDGTNASLIDTNGDAFSGASGMVEGVKITKSGRKNRLSETMQSITTKRPIVVPQIGSFTFPEDEILSSSAISYRNKNNIRCRYDLEGDKTGNEVDLDEAFNPFAYGAKGDLVLDGQFSWQSKRVNATDGGSNNHKTRFDGSYAYFYPYYKIGSDGNWYKPDEINHPNFTNHSDVNELAKWRKLGEVTRYDEYGKAIESQDQIKVHSSVLYGFNRELTLLPVAQAVNARQQEIAFDGFEDYGYYSNNALNNEETHFDFADALIENVIQINETVRHSGLASLELSPGAIATVTKDVASRCFDPVEPSGGSEFTAEECLCVIPFEPTAGEYIVSAWVKVGEDRTITQYTGIELDISISGQLPSTVLPNGPISPTGPILDGWQRMEGEFTIPLYSGTISVSLKNNTISDQVYFDDVRIHPFLAGMTTTVYDPKTLLPLATHDGYNFTTFFNYDENLNQVRVRVETIEGIKTISETEFGGQKSFNNANQ